MRQLLTSRAGYKGERSPFGAIPRPNIRLSILSTKIPPRKSHLVPLFVPWKIHSMKRATSCRCRYGRPSLLLASIPCGLLWNILLLLDNCNVTFLDILYVLDTISRFLSTKIFTTSFSSCQRTSVLLNSCLRNFFTRCNSFFIQQNTSFTYFRK